MEKIIILGGGVAGLSCLNAFLDRGMSPLLLEASTIGSPKMCGEFLAPPAMPLLKNWQIDAIQEIKLAQFFGTKTPLFLSFPRSAGACTRFHMELALAARAKHQDGRIMEEAPIRTITPATYDSPHVIHLSSGKTIEAQTIVVATGKFSQTSTQHKTTKYVGFKTHIPQVIKPQTLYMFSLTGGYLGIVPISSSTSNLTCLIQRKALEQAGGSCHAFLANLMTHHQSLKQSLEPFDPNTLDWLEGNAPEFGAKSIPNWPHAFWIGDAFASFYPAIGYGFSHSINSAVMAADYYTRHDPAGYHQMMTHHIRSKRIISKCLHKLLQKPRICSTIPPKFGISQRIGHQLLKKLDY